MRLTEEQVLQDNKRFESCNALAELKYCGREIPHRKSITNDEIRFYAWLCRSAVSMLKEQEAIVHPEPSCEMTYVTDCCCDLCGVQLIREDNYCRCCGKRIKWEDR